MIFSNCIGPRQVAFLLTILMVILSGCAPSIREESNREDVEKSDDVPVPEGFRRLYLRINADASMDITPDVDFSSKTVNVNGRDYAPGYNDDRNIWYVDVEESSFDAYTGIVMQEGSDFWYDESPISDISLPSVQFNHKFGDFAQIPLVGDYDPSLGVCSKVNFPHFRFEKGTT